MNICEAAIRRPVAGFVLTDLGERHQAATGAARINHHDLFGSPFA